MYPSYSNYSWQGWQGGGRMTQYNPDDPGAASPQYWTMWERWLPVADVLGGSINMRSKAEKYLPRLCNESDECWQTRINRSVLSPLLHRVISAAVGLILRKPIAFDGGDEAYWEEWRTNVDREGTSLDEYMGKLVYQAIAYGHCGLLVDFTNAEATNLREERERDARPYFITEQAPSILGWRHAEGESRGKLEQVRLREMITEVDGRFGNKLNRQVRVMEPGSYEIWRETTLGSNSYELFESGNYSLNEVPLAVVYAGREGTLLSRPVLEELAHLNIQHYQVQATLINALHIAGFPLLMLQGWDDNNNELQNLSIGNALAMPPEGGASYVETSNTSFDALQQELTSLEEQIGTLGITVLARPKTFQESGTAKALDRADTNSMLAQISINAEMALQQAMNWAGEYAGVEPPEVSIIRDFNADVLEGQQMAQLISLYNSGIIDKETTLKLLQRGEILDDGMDLEEIMANTESEELDSLEKEVDRMEQLSEIGEGNQPGENEPE